ncbi:hypothetical protein GQ44DRAFT_812862, partial [Phaeosphaeriaceae sp. PMI808]
ILKVSYAYRSSPLTEASLTKPRKTFLFGYPIVHSLAPKLHATLFKGLNVPWTYQLLETQGSSLFPPALKASACIDCAIAMPYRVSLNAVDAITEEARMIGAINTVFQRKSAIGEIQYIGTNTDCVGVREAFLQNCPGNLSESRGAKCRLRAPEVARRAENLHRVPGKRGGRYHDRVLSEHRIWWRSDLCWVSKGGESIGVARHHHWDCPRLSTEGGR